MTPEQRIAVVAEAMRWLGTPFHHQQRVRGAGVDCVNLLAAVYHAAGVVEELRFDYYPPDWHLHRDEPKFLAGLERYADRIPVIEALPGDIAMFRYGRHSAHGAIVTAWPTVVHAWRDVGKVVLTEADRGPLGGRLVGVWRIKEVLP